VSILLEDADLLFLGPNVQYFSNSHSLTTKYILEKRSADPGIADGDIFMSNDAYVGAPHQSDLTLSSPIFVDGQVFCWISNSLHLSDVGGNAPGSFCVDAKDAWDDPMNWPPIKLVEGGHLRPEIETLFIRQSRFPFQVQMDIRAAVAALGYTKERITRLIERYGAETVKGVMRSIMDASERTFAERLESIPDGTWSHRAFTEAANSGDRSLYTYQVNITKRGARLIVDNIGTDPQAGAINVTFAAFAGAVLCALMTQVVSDLGGAFGGAYRRVEFRPVSGLLNCAEYPAAVSPSGAFTTPMNLSSTTIAVSKMLSCGDEASRARALGTTFPHTYNLGVWGSTAVGNPFLFISTTCMFGSDGGRPSRDGIDAGGHWWIPAGAGPNVEDLESHYPLVFLYRRLRRAGLDGAGRHRGGVGIDEAYTLRGSQKTATQMMMDESFAKGAGVFGGSPGTVSRVSIITEANVLDQVGSGNLPRSAADIQGVRTSPGFKAPPISLVDGDVCAWAWPNMSGYGDPLLRDPRSVVADIESVLIDESTAERVYGVVISGGRVDEAATAATRTDRRQQRLGGGTPGDTVSPPEGALRVGDILHVVDGRWWCNGHDLGAVDENYKDRTVVRETLMREFGPEYAVDDHEMADRLSIREYLCPVTGYRIDCEIVRTGGESLHDIKLLRT
jgi:N-methylhydantoinase B